MYDNNKHMRFNLNSPEYREVDPVAMDLLVRMLEIDPSVRMTAAEVLSHPFLSAEYM